MGTPQNDVIEISRILHRLGHKVMTEAAARRDAGDLSSLQYGRIYQNVFQPLNKQSASLLAEEAVSSVAAIKKALPGVTTATRSLDRTLRKLKKIEDIAGFGAKLVEAGVLIAGFIAAPTLTAAALAATNVREAVDSAKRLT